jgi:hypothetical protein
MRGLPAVLLAVATLSIGCGPTVDLTKGLQVVDVSTGWKDAGLSNGQNKIVPYVTFKVKNVSNQALVSLQANAVFRHGTDTQDWGAVFLPIAGSDGLAAGATSEPLVAQSPLGYTGAEPRADMLQNSHFVDAHVDIMAKYGSTQWAKLGEFPIERRLLDQ